LRKLLVTVFANKNVTLTLNTDGVKVFKSSKKGSLWPIQFVNNELDASVRYKPENIILCGLWFGGDPPMELFFKPLIEELIVFSKRYPLVEINNEKIFVQIKK
jgi:hypothetical protein